MSHIRTLRRRRGLVACVLATAWLAVGCASAPIPLYAGPPKLPSEIALVASGVRVKILKVDGEAVSGARFEVLPGEHTVDYEVVFFGEEVTPHWKGQRVTCSADARFIAEAGVEYQISKLSKKGKAVDSPGATYFQHNFATQLTNVTDDETMPDAVSEMRC